WFEFANLVFAEAKAAGIELKVKNTSPVATSSYPTPAIRPLNSRLDTTKFKKTFGLELPCWDVGVKRMLHELFSASAK
ncbi:sugar nucleotide-binding protein, partial [Obesumbacterium proteus]